MRIDSRVWGFVAGDPENQARLGSENRRFDTTEAYDTRRGITAHVLSCHEHVLSGSSPRLDLYGRGDRWEKGVPDTESASC